jgi:hypothetical protein
MAPTAETNGDGLNLLTIVARPLIRLPETARIVDIIEDNLP